MSEINERLEKYASDCQEELKQLIREIAVIPAPSHHEELRVEYIKNWMEKQGAKGVYVDDALNVIWPYNVTDNNELIVVMAHTDVVFPDTDPLPFKESDGKFFCPGIGDDTARLGTLLMAAKYFTQNAVKPKYGMLFVANSCEEGLGNLKGSRMIVDTFGSRIKNFITIDSSLGNGVIRAAGSHRYKVTVKTEGGHSYGNFGNRNAIRVMSSIIDTLYSVKVPENGDSKTTYNVGSVLGGTSVNTIAQECEMLYEYRSNDSSCLAKMKVMFEKIIDAYRATGSDITVHMIGERPCNGDIDPDAHEELISKVFASYAKIGYEGKRCTGSTDANYPLSKGIPSICIGTSISGGTHTRGEWLDVSSLHNGMRFLLDFLSNYFEM